MTAASETPVWQPIDVDAALAGSRAMGQWLRDMRAHVAAGRDTEAPPAPAAVDDPAARAAMIEARKPHVETWLNRFSDLGLPLVRVKPFAKKTIDAGWQKTTQTDWPLIEQHVTGTGNPGFVLGQDVIGWDADNALGTAAFKIAGLPLFTVSAGSQDPDSRHPGGVHVLWRRPACWPKGITLSCPDNAVRLANGGLVDVLVGPHQMVLPLSVVVTSEGDQPFRVGAYLSASAAGYCDQEQDGWLMADRDGDLPELPMWAWPDAMLQYAPAGSVRGEVPAGLEALVGTVAEAVEPEPRAPREPGDDDELTEQIDELPLLEMIEAAGILGTRGGFDSCGDCETWLRNGSSAEKSITVHGGCPQYGHGVHVWTTGIPTLPQGTHSRLDAFIGLSGGDIEADRGRVMQGLGLITAKSMNFADALDRAAEKFEEHADDPESCTGEPVPMPDPTEAPMTVTQTRLSGKGGKPVTIVTRRSGTSWVGYPAAAEFWLEQAAKCRATARVLRAAQPGVEPTAAETVTDASQQVLGAAPTQHIPQPADLNEPIDAETVEVPGQPEPAAGTDLVPDDAIEGELVGGVDAVELEKVIRDLRAKIIVVEDQMRALGVPAVQRIWDYAESQGVYPHGLTCALLPLAVSSVPPNVVLPARNRQTVAKVMGQGVNIYSVNVAVSSAGKGETENAADAAIPLQQGVKRLGLGTAEYYAKELRGVDDGEPVIHTTSILNVIDEMDQLNAYLSQPGNKLPGFMTMAYQNGQGGQGTSNKDNASVLPKHGSRIGFMVNSQPEKMTVLAQHNAIGAEARFIAGNTGLIHPDHLGPLYGLTVAPVMADQSSQPWHHTGHVADPPIPCQQPESARAAAAAVPNITNIGSHRTEGGEEKKGHRGWDDAPPIWVTLPPKAEAALAESHRISAELAADPTLALKAQVSAHRVVTILHASVGFAVLDGGYNPTDAQWEAAELLVTGSDLVKEMCRAYIALKTQTAAFEEGKIRGAGNAGSRAAEAAITTSALHSAMNGILDRLQKAGGVATPRDVRNGVTGKFGGLSKPQRNQMYPAFTALERAQRVHLGGDGTWRIGPAPAVITS